MNLSLTIDTSEGRRRLDLLSSRLSDLTPVLREFDKYKRERVQAIFDAQGPGWEPRAKPHAGAELQRREAGIREAALGSLRKSLLYDVKRAKRRADAGKGRVSAMIKREAVLDRFDEQVANGAIDFDALANGDKRFLRRNPRAIARYKGAGEIARRLLGKIPQSIVSKIEKGLLTIESKIPWAGIHNEGGTAGNDAEIPARTFLEWDDIDLGFLVILLREAGLLAIGA